MTVEKCIHTYKFDGSFAGVRYYVCTKCGDKVASGTLKV